MKKIFWFFSGIPLLICLCVALIIFDPLQIFHKSFFSKYSLSNNMSYQASGIINSFSFDSIIIGSSLMTNTSSNEANKKIQGTWANLSINGGNISKRSIVLEYALSKHKIKQVIFSMEPAQIVGDSDERNSSKSIKYLYDDNRLNDIQVYLNHYYISCLFFHSICLRGDNDIDRPAALQSKWQSTLEKGGLNNILANKDQEELDLFLKRKTSLLPEYKSFFKIIQQHPKTQFYIVLPPLSRLFYKIYATNSKKMISDMLDMHFNNVKIFGFDNTDIPDNLSRYVDLVHYDEKVNSFMLDAIKNDTHRITLENIDNYFEEMQKKVEAYDIESLRKQIIESGVLDK